jgi:septation ring formation regulator EzrA
MRHVIVASVLALAPLSACDAPKQDEPIQKATKPGELKQAGADTKMSEAELEEARKKAGFKSYEDEAAENMAAMEKGEREYIKRRLPKYREAMKTVRGFVDQIEKEAAAWPKAKDPQAAFDKFAEKYKEDMKAFMESYNELTENGIRGGAAAAKVGAALRSLADLNNDLSPEISKEASFNTALADIRKSLDEVDKELDTIEKDETLDVSGAEGETDAPADGDDAKADDAKADDKKADDKKAG